MDAAEESYIRNEAKKALRGRMKALRNQLPVEARAKRSAAATTRLLELSELASRDRWCVAGFVSIRAEIDVSEALEAARGRGATVVLPRVELRPEAGTATMVWHRYEAGDELIPGAFRVPEPRPDAPVVGPADIDVVLVPGLVMDERGHRVGYGGGFYDRALPQLVRAFSCGVCFGFQLVGELPTMPHDQSLDAVVTDERVVRITAGARSR